MSTATSTPYESSIEPLDERGSAVRFETQCVVIPDHVQHRSSRWPSVVTKSYALPLWRRRSSSAGPNSALEDRSFATEGSNQSHLVLRVPLPTLSLKPPSATRSVDHVPLPPPCLVHRSQPSEPASPRTSPQVRQRRKTSPSPPRTDLVTVPLRPCCAACETVTEAALADGDAWQERFSRAALRKRRSLSMDGASRTLTVAGSAAATSYGALSVSINVDEVDKRRRSSICEADSSTFSDGPFSPVPNSSADDSNLLSPPSALTTPRIQEDEEDEDTDMDDDSELFPLPSPSQKRTPEGSPSPSLSSLQVANGGQNCSTYSEHSPSPQPNKRRDLLAPPSPQSPCLSASLLGFPKFSDSMINLVLSQDNSSPDLLSTFPSLSGRELPRAPSPCLAFGPTDATIPATKDDVAQIFTSEPQPMLRFEPVSVPIAIPTSPGTSCATGSPAPSSLLRHLAWRPKRAVSESGTSPPPSFFSTPSPSPPSLSKGIQPKRAFSVTGPLFGITDVLRGVGAVASGGITPGI